MRSLFLATQRLFGINFNNMSPVPVIVPHLYFLSLTDVKYKVLSLSCRKGDLECVKMMMNKYDCDFKGLAHKISVVTTNLYNP